MTYWRWSALFAVAAMAIMASFAAIDGMSACGGGDPIFAFEMVRTPQDVKDLFPDTCRAVHAEAQRKGLWLDIALFVWVYSAFLISGLLALKQEGGAPASGLVKIAIAAAVIAALADQFENAMLLKILDTLPGTQRDIDWLYAAPRLKFALLGVVTVLAGWLHWQRPGWRKIVGALAILGGLWSNIGLISRHEWVLTGMTLGWLALAMAAFILCFRAADHRLGKPG